MDFKEKLKNLTPDKLNLLLNKAKKTESTIMDKSFDRINKFFPLSFSQKRIWFQSQIDKKNETAYNNHLALVVKLSSPLDFKRLEDTVNEIIKKNEILRTTFHFHNGNPFQSIKSSLKLAVTFKDLRNIPNSFRMDKGIEYSTIEAKKPFNLEKGPLMRFCVFQINDLEYIFQKVTHHLVSDGWSNNLFFSELTKGLFYVEKKDCVQPQYLEFVFWEKERFQKSYYDNLLKFWKNYLHGQLPLTHFPQEGLVDKKNSDESAQKTYNVDKELNKKIRDFSKSRQVTLFVTLISVFNILLYRYTGESDLLIGLPYVNRQRLKFQKTLGLFINLIPFRIQIKKNDSYLVFLKSTDKMIKEVFSYAELPFNTLVKNLNPKRNFGIDPLFQILFIYQNFPHAYDVPEVELRPLPIDTGQSQYNLTFMVEESPDQLLIKIKYKKDVFDSYFIDNIYEHFKNILASVIENPNQSISKISYLSQDEKRWLLSNAGHVKKGKDDLFCNLFEQQVHKTPSQTAIDYLGTYLTYETLNKKANQLANYLRTFDLKGRVAICLEQSSDFLISVLAVLKAGFSFVPMDNTHPKQRIKTLLKEAQTSLFITQSSFFLQEEFSNVSVILIDKDLGKIEKQCNNNLNLNIEAKSLAYIVFTSGSTGNPKGVCVEHGQLASYINSINLEVNDPTLQNFGFTSTVAADMGYTNLFYPLTKGKIVVIIPKNLMGDPDLLSEYLEKHPIDCLKYVPSQLNFLLKAKVNKTILPKKLLILAGEATPYSLIEQIRQIDSNCRVIISYGPTETTIGVMTNQIVDKKPWSNNPLLGHPNKNSEIYLLDENMELVPRGVKGEIVIGGKGVSRGYFNQLELTAKYFVQNPFSTCKDSRLYKTGDIARYLKTGDLEFIGRKDRQIKLRGYRVELGEIESALNRIKGVFKAGVVFGDKLGSEQIIAFVILKSGSKLDSTSIKRKLQSFFPSYMIPSQIFLLDQIPLTFTGKIDYSQLISNFTCPKKPYFLSPRDSVEITLVEIWKEVLQLEKVGIDENFFDLGGHSFLALELMLKIDQLFGVRMPLSILFESQTIQSLAEKIRKDSPLLYENPLVTIQKGNGKTSFFLVHPAGGQVLCYIDLATSMKNDLHFYGLQSSFLSIDCLDTYESIEKIANYYLHYTGQVDSDQIIFGGWSSGGLISFEMARQYAQEKGKRPLVVILDQPVPSFVQDELGSSLDDAQYLVKFVNQIDCFRDSEIGLTYDQLKDKSFKEQSSVVYRSFVEKQLIPKDVDEEGFEKYLELQKTQSFASKQYKPKNYEGPVLLIRASDSQWNDIDSKSLGWESIASNLELKSVSGTHFTIMKPPQVTQIVEIIEEWIRKNEISCV